MKKKVLALLLSAAMVLSLAACGEDSGNDNNQPTNTNPPSTSQPSTSGDNEGDTGDTPVVPAETVVIRYGTHWINGIDPNYVDPVTGEYTMEPAPRQAALVALQAVKDTYNVEIEFLQYPVDVQTDLMTSVLAGDPICDLALLWGGVEPTILTQNVLQDLTPFVEEGLFEGYEWNLKEEMFGGYYLLNDEFGLTYFPLIVNLTMLEQVPGLIDELGYPMDLFEEGKWTWNTFKDYLSRVDAYYRNNDAKDGAWINRQAAYETDHRYAALGAIHANGGAIFNGEVTADSKEVIDAVAYIKDLMDADLLLDCGLYDDGYTPRWCDGGADFGIGNTVFTDAPNWNIGWYASQCAERGESIAIIPWPRPDRMSSVDDPDYMQSTNGGNSVAILKGVSEEKTRLAIQTYILYWNTYYQALGGVDSVADYQAQTAVTELANRGVDVYNEVYGQSAIDCYTFILGHMNNNWAHTLGLWDGRWETILGESLYGLNGTGSYDVAIQARKTELSNRIETISAALKSGEIHDTYKPTLTSETAVLEAGTDPATVDWTRYFTAEDTVDGVIAITADNITVSEDLDLATPGEYRSAVKVEVSDSSDNSANTSITVIVYDADNKTAPTVAAKEELPVIALNTETSGIDWTAYLETAEDADGINVKSKVTANLSTLDTTTPGTYSVTLTVTDYAGNSTEVTIDVTVE